jgi:hypothetical protein
VTNLIYPKWKVERAKGTTPDMSAGGTNVKAVLVDAAGYTYSAAHQFLSDVPSGARVATSGNLANKVISATTAVLDADDFALSSVAAGPAAENLIFYVDTGVEGTSPLVAFFDTATGLPVTPNGGNINIVVNGSGLFVP